jgi:hypothetical protein
MSRPFRPIQTIYFPTPQLSFFVCRKKYTNLPEMPGRLRVRTGELYLDSTPKRRLLSPPLRPGRIWGSVSLLSNGYVGSFPGYKADGAQSLPFSYM